MKGESFTRIIYERNEKVESGRKPEINTALGIPRRLYCHVYERDYIRGLDW
jgi:hypothetical protein